VSIRFTRRALVGSALALPFATLAPQRLTRVSAQTAEQVWRHGVSLFGTVKYPPGFAHFDYVNPRAPKGGSVRQSSRSTLDNCNMVVADVKGALYAGIDLIHDTLMMAAHD